MENTQNIFFKKSIYLRGKGMEKYNNNFNEKRNPNEVSAIILAKRMDIRSLQSNTKEALVERLDRYNRPYWIKVSPQNLNANKDNVIIYGQDSDGQKYPIQTNHEGQIKIDSVEFVNLEEETSTNNNWESTISFDVSKFKTYTIAIINIGDDDAEVKLQISPDDEHFFTENFIYHIPKKDINLIVPNRFLRYARLLIKTKKPGCFTILKIILQAQK